MKRGMLPAVALLLALAGCSNTASEDDDTGLTTTVTGGTSTSTTDDSASASGSDKFDVQGGGDGGAADDGGPMTCDQDVDIVFVMDVSTSMDAFLDKLAQEILVVDAALNALNLPNPPHYGLVVFVDDTALLNNGAPYPDVQTLQADFQMWSQFTATNQQVGGGNLNTTWPENSLDALYTAAVGFQWRPAASALRMIIHTTDDTFWEGPATQNGVMIQRNYGDTVAKLQEQEIRSFSFAALIGGSCQCDDVSPGWFGPYMGMPSIPDSTDGAVWNIDEVLAGTTSLSAAINGAVDDKMCMPYPPPG